MSQGISAQEIKDIRLSYGLTQKSFATLLGIGVASIARYETGTRPSKANENLIRAAKNAAFMLDCLERDGMLIPEEQRMRAHRVAYAVVELPSAEEAAEVECEKAKDKVRDAASENDAPLDPMTARYMLTLRQEVLNEQAANVVADAMRLKYEWSECDDAPDALSVLISLIFDMKRQIIAATDIKDPYLDHIEDFLKCADAFIDELSNVSLAA